MRRDIAEKWAYRLRHGHILQGKNVLAKGDRRCCLGVLCDMAVEEGIVGVIRDTHDLSGEECHIYDPTVSAACCAPYGSHKVLPDKVMQWAGMRSECGSFEKANGNFTSLAVMNDNGYSFNEIADYIEIMSECL